MEVRKVIEEWEIWNEEKEAVKSEKEVKKLVSKNSISGFMFLGKRQVNKYLQGNFETT